MTDWSDTGAKNNQKSEETKVAKLSTILQRTSALIAVLASIIAVSIGMFISLSPKLSDVTRDTDRVRLQLENIKMRMEDQETQVRQVFDKQKEVLDRLSATLAAIKNVPEASAVAGNLAQIKSEVASLSRRVSQFESALLNSPATALSVPLLRQDFEHMKDSHGKLKEDLSKQIDRVYDQNKWFIGLIFTMAIGLVSLAVSNFAQARRTSTPKHD